MRLGSFGNEYAIGLNAKVFIYFSRGCREHEACVMEEIYLVYGCRTRTFIIVGIVAMVIGL